uniref:Ig-like domain-containing protein n=1 Tax=Acanthochromis polyacanthus TaxID=80966 RepID=A0A3Q1G567_9TELE
VLLLLFSLFICVAEISAKIFVTKTVGVGQDVTLICSRNSKSGGLLFWFRVVTGNLPEVLGATYTFDSSTFNETPRITAKQEPGTFILRITQTKLSDTAFYYCEEIVELRTTFLNITFLAVKEADITAVIQDVPSERVHPGNPTTLQCSVLSESKEKTCLEPHRVFWFRAGSDQSHHSSIYVHGNGSGKCEKSESRSSQKCVYSLSQDITSSDAGTFYCAVATCGQILFGNGTKLEMEGLTSVSILIFFSSQHLSKWCRYSYLACNNVYCVFLQTEDSLVYSALNFTRKNAGTRRPAREVEGESIYSEVIFWGVNSNMDTEGQN